jgi:hypothetical protein
VSVALSIQTFLPQNAFWVHTTPDFCRNRTAIEQWAANALATGGTLAEIASRPGIVKLLDLLKEDDDEDSEEDSD